MVDISVVMCTYNGAEFLREQLDSILAQTLPPLEVVVADDGSTDATLEIVESVADAAARRGIGVHAHRNTRRLGFADNFLSACAAARGTHISFSDQDDIWAPEKLERCAAALAEHGAALCVHDVEPVGRDGVSPLPERADRTTRGAFGRPARTRVVESLADAPWSKYYGSTMLFDRRLLDRLPAAERGADPHAPGASLSHDRWVCFLASVFGRTVVLGEQLARYRQHDAQCYGGDVRRGLGERWRTMTASGPARAWYLADLAAYRASLLESVTASSAAVDAETLTLDARRRAGARRWRRLAAHQSARARLHEPVGPLVRLRTVAGNLRRGTYRSYRHEGLGARSLAVDLAVATLARPGPPEPAPVPRPRAGGTSRPTVAAVLARSAQ